MTLFICHHNNSYNKNELNTQFNVLIPVADRETAIEIPLCLNVHCRSGEVGVGCMERIVDFSKQKKLWTTDKVLFLQNNFSSGICT